MREEAVKGERAGRSWFRGRYSAWIWLGAYFLFQTLAALVKLPKESSPWIIAVARLISIAGYMFLALAMLAALAAFLKSAGRAALALAAGLLIWIGTLFLLRHPPSPLIGLFLFNLMDAGRALAAAGLGVLVAALIRDPNILLPATVFAAFADYLMVYTSIGTVNKALQTPHGQKVIQSMSAHVPTPHPAIVPLTVGMADYVFLAFFFACIYRFGMNERATFAAFFAALTLSLLFVAYVSAIPALAPMALAFVAVNFRHFRLSKSELQAMGMAYAIVVVVVVAMFLFRRS